MHGAPPTPDPHRILGFHPDMGRSGEMVPSAAPPRRKAAPKIGVAAAGQPRRPRFPPDTDLLHQNTPEVDPARSKPNRGLGRDAWKGRGQYLQIWHACGSPSSRPNPQARRTPRQQGPPPLDPMASAKKKRRRPRRHLPRRPHGLSRRSSPVAARGVGRWGRRRGKTLDSPESP